MVSLIDMLIPDSSNDFLAILLWVLIGILIVLICVDLYFFWSYRKPSHKREEPPQIVNQVESTPLSTADRLPEIHDIGTKVDQILKAHKL